VILTDGIHLISDKSLDELHDFAVSIGLKRHFFQGKTKGHPHYDLTTSKASLRARTNGATLVSAREIILGLSRLGKGVE
jgi:hypothetical protein